MQGDTATTFHQSHNCLIQLSMSPQTQPCSLIAELQPKQPEQEVSMLAEDGQFLFSIGISSEAHATGGNTTLKVNSNKGQQG